MSSLFSYKNSIVLDNNKAILFKDGNNSIHTVLDNSNGNLSLNSITNGNLSINSLNGPLFLNSNASVPSTILNGILGIGMTSANLVKANLTLVPNSLIGFNTTTGTNNGYIAIAAANTIGSAFGARTVLYGNDSNTSPGCVKVYTGNSSLANLSFYTSNESLSFQISSSGSSYFSPNGSNVTCALGSTSGAFYTPLVLFNTANAIGLGSGGSLTLGGGASINGDLYLSGAFYNLSDFKYKTDVQELEYGILDKIQKIRTAKYKMNDKLQYGFIAQDFLEDFPELVSRANPDCCVTLDYQKVSVLLLQCIKELVSKK
jgi:hypothetical protein